MAEIVLGNAEYVGEGVFLALFSEDLGVRASWDAPAWAKSYPIWQGPCLYANLINQYLCLEDILGGMNYIAGR